MNFACTVCYEILKSTDNIHSALCGHLLHYHCWIGWLERSQNCPECREPTHPSQLIKLFFNTGEGDDYCTLSNKYNSLRCELQCKFSEIQTITAVVEEKKELRDLQIIRERERMRFRKEIEDLKAQERSIREKKHQKELRLRSKIKILKRQTESICMQSLKLRESKDINEKKLKNRIKALKIDKRRIQKSKDEELERLREVQKANFRFLQQFSERSVKLVEKLKILRRSEDVGTSDTD